MLDRKARKALAGPAVRPAPCLTHHQDCPFILTNLLQFKDERMRERKWRELQQEGRVNVNTGYLEKIEKDLGP